MSVIVTQCRLSPAAEVEVEIGSGRDAAFDAVIHVRGARKSFVRKPGVIGQQKRPENAAITRGQVQVARVLAQVAFVVGKIENGNAVHVEDGVGGLDVLARNNSNLACTNLHERVRDIVHGHVRVGRRVDFVGIQGNTGNMVADVPVQSTPLGVHRCATGAEPSGAHLPRYEIILDARAHPNLVLPLDAHVACGCRLAGLLVDGSAVRRQHGSVPLDDDVVG